MLSDMFLMTLQYRLCTFWTKSVPWRTRCSDVSSNKAWISNLAFSLYVLVYLWIVIVVMHRLWIFHSLLPVIFVKCRSPVFSLMQWELLVVNVLRKYTIPNIATFFEFHLEQRRELFANGSQDSKSGPTLRLSVRWNFHHKWNTVYVFCFYDLNFRWNCIFFLSLGCCQWTCKGVGRKTWSDRRKLQWRKHRCLFVSS